VELDLVDPVPVAVVRAQDGRVLVGEPPPLERLAAGELAERGRALLRPAAALAPQRLDERAVLLEEVVALERRRLVLCVGDGQKPSVAQRGGCKGRVRTAEEKRRLGRLLGK
jgi:hypothetical protein